MKRLTQMKEDYKIDTAYQEKLNEISQDLDQIFGKLKVTLCNIIDEACKKAKAYIQEKYFSDNRGIMKAFEQHEKNF